MKKRTKKATTTPQHSASWWAVFRAAMGGFAHTMAAETAVMFSARAADEAERLHGSDPWMDEYDPSKEALR